MDMNERVEILEAMAGKTAERLSALERDVAIIKATCATKADLAELKAEMLVAIAAMKSEIADTKSSIIVWVVGAFFLTQLLPAVLKHFGL